MYSQFSPGTMATRTMGRVHGFFNSELGLTCKDIKSVHGSRFHIRGRHLRRIPFEFSSLGGFTAPVDVSKCREHGLPVRREDVGLMLKELDPRGASLSPGAR